MLELAGKGRSGRLATHVRPPTLEGHNFFVRTPFRVFLDSMESPLSQDFIYMTMEAVGELRQVRSS